MRQAVPPHGPVQRAADRVPAPRADDEQVTRLVGDGDEDRTGLAALHPCLYLQAAGYAAEAFVERNEGFKAFARGYLSDAAGVTVEAEGVFIKPAWAREAE